MEVTTYYTVLVGKKIKHAKKFVVWLKTNGYQALLDTDDNAADFIQLRATGKKHNFSALDVERVLTHLWASFCKSIGKPYFSLPNSTVIEISETLSDGREFSAWLSEQGVKTRFRQDEKYPLKIFAPDMEPKAAKQILDELFFEFAAQQVSAPIILH